MSERIYIGVSKFCLVEAIRELEKQGAVALGLSKEDDSWLLSFDKALCKPVEDKDSVKPEQQFGKTEQVTKSETISKIKKAKKNDNARIIRIF